MKKVVFSLILAASGALPYLSQGQGLAEAINMYSYNRFETAKKLLTPLAASSAEANYYLGLSEIGVGNLSAAKAIFEKYPSDIANQSGIARVLILEKKNAEAMAILEGIVKKAKKKDILPFKYAADAITYTDGADFTKAVNWYKMAIEKNPNADLYTGLGDAYFYLPNSGGEAYKAWDNALSNKPASPAYIYFRIGELWYSSRNYDSSNANFNKVNELDPKNPLPYEKLANAYYKQGKYDLAKGKMEKFLELSDKSIEDQYKYINILYLSKDYANAVTKIDEIFAKGETRPYLYRLQGYSQYELAKYPEALAAMDKFFAVQEKSKILPMDYEYYSRILAKTPGREAEAVNFQQKAIDVDTAADKSEAYRKVAAKYKSAEDYGNAALWYGKLVDNNKGNSELLDLYWAGFCNFYVKNYDQSKKYFELMAQQHPTENSSNYFLARIAAAGDPDAKTGAGIEPFKKYIDLVGEANPEKKSELLRVYDYMIYYYYNKKDAVNATLYCNKQLAVNPGNEYATKILNYFKN